MFFTIYTITTILMTDIRAAIEEGRYAGFKEEALYQMKTYNKQ